MVTDTLAVDLCALLALIEPTHPQNGGPAS